ncbi:MAG TPA: hypothetical protein VJQ57_09230 [Acidimicrobiia bacterium]|nr:hypothetical protein [Acidimicrobiia bacterium]
MDRCEVARCRAEASIVYLGHGVCETHWNKLAAEDAPPDALRMALGVESGHRAAVEGRTVDDGAKTSKSEQAETPAKGKGKGKKAAPTKATAKAEAPAEKKGKREPIEDACVFAFRLSVADRTRIHEAAGPAGATRFVRSAALAAASGDRDAFNALVEQARTNLK